jgi:hypothetical protein
MLNKICSDILQAFSVTSLADYRELYDKTDELTRYFYTHSATPALVASVIELENSIIEITGPHKQYLEKCIFRVLIMSAYSCEPESKLLERPKLSQDLAGVVLSAEQKLRQTLALQLLAFSEEILARNRSRDAFANKRKGLALQLLDKIDVYYDVPQCEKLYGAAIASGKEVLVPTAAEFYENYLRRRNTQPAPEILALLDKLVRKTKSRSVAVAALNLQVVTGVISELGALSEIDDWKEKNSYRC